MARKSGSSGEETARKLRIASTKLFAQHGYAAVSMRQIATEIGVQAGALYLYTPDKQSLLFDLMHSHMQELLDSWAIETLKHESDPQSQLNAFVCFHIQFHMQRLDEVFIAYMELRNLSEPNFKIITQQRQEYENLLNQLLTKGVRQGIFHVKDVKLATFGIIAMLTGINTWFRDAGRLSADVVSDVYLKMVLDIVNT